MGPADPYCGRCGARQPVPAAPLPGLNTRPADPLSGISPRTASILCYVPWMGWIAAVVVLSSEKFRRDRVVRFHAFQGLYLFVAWLLNQYVLRWMPWPFPHFQFWGIITALLLFAAIFMMVKAAHEEMYSLPVFGELAARSVAED